ncbi:MAG: glycosyltransferase family 39 protein [Candidatus Omnitrophica bacterium]|nr:glycosyltransferase family 39 protein [Candidatus Omnitrophota bacterium]MCB9720324.1 glycosyltransferase family 39 protein [Candidatus Omnitrophota bacterium]
MNDNPKIPQIALYAAIILLAGFALRFVTITAPYTSDERRNIVVATDLGWSNLAMEDPYVQHPLLNVYLTRLGMTVFDQSKFGVRFLHLLFGTLTMLLVYLLMRDLGRRASLLALTLLALSQYHIHVSVKAENASLLLFLLTLAIYLFYKAIVHGRERYIYWVGPVMGLAFLTKGVAIVMAAAFFLFLLSSKAYRGWLKRRELWISAGLFLLTIVPWLIWILLNGSSQLIFSGEMYAPHRFGPRLTALNFYLIEVLSWIRGWDYRLVISWEHAIVDGVTGTVMLGSVLASLFVVKHELKRLLLWVFAVYVVGLSFFSKPGLPWGEFWWAAPSLIPAVCLTAAVGAHFAKKHWAPRIIVSLFIGYALINAIHFIGTAQENFAEPPHRLATFVDIDPVVARIHLDRGRMQAALTEMESLRQQTPNNVDVLNYYGLVSWQAGKKEKAVELWLQAASLEPDYRSRDNLLNMERQMLLDQYVTRAARHPDDARTRYMLGALYYYYGDDKLAAMDLTRSVEINPLNHRAQYFLGLTHFRQQNFGEAIKAFQAVLDGHPHHYGALYYLGRVYQELGQDEQAIEHFKAATTLNPDDAHSYFELSQLYQGKPQLAGPMNKKARSIYHLDIKHRVYPFISGRYRALFNPQS